MKKETRKFAVILTVFMMAQPVVFADAKLNKEIVTLELELVKMNAKTGEYADMSEAQLKAKIEKTKKTLEKKKAKAKKEAQKDLEQAKKEMSEAGKNLKDAGKNIGNAVKGFFD